MAIPAGTDKEERHRVSAQEHQTQEDPRLDQEDQLPRRHRGDPTAHVEGTEITLALKDPVGKPARLSEKKTLVQKYCCCSGCSAKTLCIGLTGDTGCEVGLGFPTALIMGGRIKLAFNKEAAFALSTKKPGSFTQLF